MLVLVFVLVLVLVLVLASAIQSGQLSTVPISQVAAGRQGQGATITRACPPNSF